MKITTGRFTDPRDAIDFSAMLMSTQVIKNLVLVASNHQETIEIPAPADKLVLENGVLYFYQGKKTWWKYNIKSPVNTPIE